MQFEILLLLLALLVGSVSEVLPCGTSDSHPGIIKIAKARAAETLEIPPNVYLAQTPTIRLKIDTYAHAIGGIPPTSAKANITAQMKVLNDAYKPYGIDFHLVNVSTTDNANWADMKMNTGEELAMKRALSRGGYDSLNLYFLDYLYYPHVGRMYGYCWFPDSLDEPYYRGDLNVLQQGGGSEIFDLDGCMIEWEVTLGGSVKAHSLGVSIVHEVGHWLGLQHVFQSKSCEGPGDHIPDTPIQATESRGCLIGKDSCPDSPGKDSIHNYMDYSNDTCRYEFTPDQQRLIYDYWVAYRANKGSTSMVLTWEWAL